MFPNYVDADPVALSQSVTAFRRSTPTTYVPGHGAVAKEADLARYAAVLEAVEAAARAAKQKGLAPADAAAGFTLPSSLGEWTILNKAFYERAIVAWYRRLPA
jgi:glyoxylase-like metal-dependent hydrolase (beta-lactamase superfamily II)